MVQTALKFNMEEDFSEDSFLVSKSNKDAIAWIKKWPEWPAHCLIIYGEKSSGKTHLSHIWKSLSEADFIYNNEFSVNDLSSDKNYILENYEEFDQKNLFHLYNTVKENGKFLLLTSRYSVEASNIKLPDLLSRLYATPSIEIKNPDDDLIRTILLKQFSDRQIRIDSKVLDYLIPRLERSFSSLNDFVQNVDSSSMSQKREITIPFIRSVLLESG